MKQVVVEEEELCAPAGGTAGCWLDSSSRTGELSFDLLHAQNGKLLASCASATRSCAAATSCISRLKGGGGGRGIMRSH